jgi:small-conductance mechanosensitive channel
VSDGEDFGKFLANVSDPRAVRKSFQKFHDFWPRFITRVAEMRGNCVVDTVHVLLLAYFNILVSTMSILMLIFMLTSDFF